MLPLLPPCASGAYKYIALKFIEKYQKSNKYMENTCIKMTVYKILLNMSIIVVTYTHTIMIIIIFFIFLF